MKEFYLRCDDVTAPDRAFLRAYRLVRKAGLPLDCAVIPALAGRPLAEFLAAEKKAGAAVEPLQHGLSHAEHSGNIYLKQEFGPARTYARQKADIRTGRKLMRGLFGAGAVPVFVPPFHACNTDTLKALAALGFAAISCTKLPPGAGPAGPAFLPVRVTVNEYDLKLKPRRLDAALLRARTLGALREKGPAGIYFHHADLNRADLEVFGDYLSFLKRLEKKKLAVFRLCSELLKRSSR